MNTEPSEPPPEGGAPSPEVPTLEGTAATPSEQNQPAKPQNGAPKGKPAKLLPSPRLAVPKQLDALRAFAIAVESEGAAVTNEQAGKIIEMAAGTIVVCNAFMCEMGLLIRKESGKFDVSDTAKAFHKAYEWNADTAPLKLAVAFQDKWFAKALLPRLKMRDWGKEEATQLLAEAANASKEYQSQVAMLLEFLAAVGLVQLDGNTVRQGQAATGEADPVAPPAQAPAKVQQVEEPEGDVCYLNKDRSRKVVIIAPLDISKPELARLKKWLDLNYFAEDDEPA